MRNLTQILALGLAVAALAGGPAWAGGGVPALPKAIGYALYVDGVEVGHSRMAIRQGADAVVFESQTHVQLGPNVIDLKSRTVADPKTFRVREFSFDGTKGGMSTATHVVVAGDSATGWVKSTAATGRRPATVHDPAGFVVWEDWVMDLEVALALRQRVSGANRTEYRLVFANSFLPADMIAGFAGETEIQARDRSMVARRLEIFLFGGNPLYSHVDPETGIPVYIDFPGTRTEAFREDFFGDNPLSRYTAPADK